MKKLKLHYLQHVPFEGLGHIETWAKQKGHQLSATLFFQHYHFPSLTDFDWLIIMGGPMGVYDEDKYSWLNAEKQFIQSAIQANKTVIGICLGAQLIATVLGAKVYPNSQKEIGWLPVSATEQGRRHSLLKGLLSTFLAFHWHGDTFDLPSGAVHLFETDACRNQAFIYKNKVLGLQFHLEATPETLTGMVQHCRQELIAAAYVQQQQVIMEQAFSTLETNKVLTVLLDKLAE